MHNYEMGELMMKLKSLVGLIVIVMMAFFITACGNSNETSTNKEDNTTASSQNKDGKTLRVITNAQFAPMEYLENGKVVGFDADLIKAVAKEAGYDVKVEHVGWDSMLVEVENGNADLAIAGITINDKRKQTYDFSYPYYQSSPKIIVKEDSDIKSLNDLKDKVVAVQNGTTGQETAEKVLGEKSPNLKKMEDNNVAILELVNGGADAVVTDKPVAEEYVKNNPDQHLKIVDIPDADLEYYGIMFPKGSDLVDDFDKALNTLFENGKYEKIYKDWFGTEPDIDALKALQ